MIAYLTDTQERIVRAIRELTDKFGYPPSIREIAHAVGLSSTSSVAYQLRTMERNGIVTHTPHRSRSYQVHLLRDGAA
ncbi:LexA family protein [Streptomyces sp. NPDC054933]